MYWGLPGDPIHTDVAHLGYRRQTDEFGVDSIRQYECRAVERVVLSLELFLVTPPYPASAIKNFQKVSGRFKIRRSRQPESVGPALHILTFMHDPCPRRRLRSFV